MYQTHPRTVGTDKSSFSTAEKTDYLVPTPGAGTVFGFLKMDGKGKKAEALFCSVGHCH